MASADWCATDGILNICGTRMIEHSRTEIGERWCFRCRRRHAFWRVIMAPDGVSWYGPHAEIVGVGRECSDLFPGWSREWNDDA